MGYGPRPWEINTNLAIITALREVDTDGVHTALCDAEELAWRRIAMGGASDPAGGYSVPATLRSGIELLRLDPDKYFDVVRSNGASFLTLITPRPRRSVPSTDEERAQAWAKAREQVRGEHETWLRRWRKKR